MENARKAASIVCKNAFGENNNWHKLTEVQVKEIRQKYIPWKYTQRQLAEEYNVNQVTISLIIRKVNWKYLIQD